jgi:hypothetical protein
MFDKIYFGSGGFYLLYHHIGAIRELHAEYNKPNSKMSRKIIYYGDSAGASAAVICHLVLENLLSLDKLYEILGFMSKFDILNLNFTAIGCSLLDRLFDNCPPDTHARISGVVHIGVTTKTGHKHISQFETNADVYNALLCSASIPGISNYESKIGGETCIDGAYSFTYDCLPAGTMIIKLSMFSAPLTLTIPPLIIQQSLIEFGKQNVIDYMNNTKSVTDKCESIKKCKIRDLLDKNGWLVVQELIYKNPMWKTHIETKTKSKISDTNKKNTQLNAGLFDIFNYVHYAILNHRH